MKPLLAFALALVFAACTVGPSADDGALPEGEAYDGTVVYQDLEGGFYGIETTTGEQLLPLDLPEAYRSDGLAVRVWGTFPDDVATVQQWGRPFAITRIERR